VSPFKTPEYIRKRNRKSVKKYSKTEKGKLSRKRAKKIFKIRHGHNSNLNRARIVKCLYGLSKEEYGNLLKSQDWKCAICKLPEAYKDAKGKVRNLSVDHNHNTNKIRGLLCIKCNCLLGNAKEDLTILLSAIKYLTENNV